MAFRALLSGLILALLLAPTTALSGQDVDSTQAITWLAEFQDACQRVEPIWPESLCGPLMVVDPGRRTAFLNQPDPAGRFEPKGGAYVGTLPDELQVANTAVDWGGTRWTMVMASSMGADVFPRLRLMAHEAFHRIQPALGVTQASPMPGHLDDEWPRIWLRMELRALAAALAADPGPASASGRAPAPASDPPPTPAQGDAARQAAVDALHFRIQRVKQHPEADSLESLLEANEGVAEYTGFRFAMEATGEGVERVVDAMERFESTPTYVRALGYGTGPALGLLLDRFAEGWQRDVGSSHGGDSVPHMARALAMALDVPYPEAGSGSGDGTAADSAWMEELRVRAALYGFSEVAREERERAAIRAAREAEYRQRLVEGPVLTIEETSMRGTFNPNEVFPLGDLGSVHPTAMFQGDWGWIQVDEGGVLVSTDWTRIQVGAGRLDAPADPGETIQGPGWSLELNPGWSVVAGERDGDWKVAPALPLAGQESPAVGTEGRAASPRGTDTVPGQQTPLVASRLTGAIEFDGRVDEAGWLSIEPLPALVSSPTFGATPSEHTELRIAYDDDFLYISGAMHDRNPDGIRGTSLRRDDSSLSNDWLAVTIDGYRDRENSLVFGVTPAGVRTDGEFPNDAESGPNFAWNAFWDAIATRTETGWSAEIRIPFTELPYQPDEAGRVVMGITVWRNIARRNEIISWPVIEPLWNLAIVKASQTADVEFQGLSRRRALYATPYLLAGASRVPSLTPAGDAWVSDEEGVREVGLDVKVGVTANLTLDVTLNTDFAQVEADDQEVNLTRFSLFFPERRLFFQERAGIFSFDTGDSDRLFYSRRIGLVDGQPARIYGGARVVGRIGEWDVGAINMQTAAADDGTQNVGTLRLRRRLHNSSSYGGGMLTTLMGEDGRYNVGGGLDVILNLAPLNYLSANWAQTWSDDDPSGAGLADRGLGRIRFERRGLDGLGMDVAISRAGSRYDPALGFLRRRDFTRIGDAVGWGWRAPPESPLLRNRLAVRGLAFFQNDGFTLESLEVGPEWTIEMKSSRRWVASATLREERVDNAFGITGASIPAGEYRWVEGRLAHTLPTGGVFRGTLSLEGGRFYDGSRIGFSASPIWNASRHLELNGLYQASRITFPQRPDGEERTTVQVARLRTRVYLSRALSTAFFVQYSTAAARVTLNARLRYNRREGQDLYLVYNDGLNADRASFEPHLPLSAGRTLLLKYSHAVPFGW